MKGASHNSHSVHDGGDNNINNNNNSSSTQQQQAEEEEDSLFAVQHLSIQDTVSPVSEFDPQPIKMSRGSTQESLEHLEDNATRERDDHCNNNDTHRCEALTKKQSLLPSSNNNSCCSRDKMLLLTANHQKLLSERSDYINQDSRVSISNKSQASFSSMEDNSSSIEGGGGCGGGNSSRGLLTGAWGWIRKQNEKQKQKQLTKMAEEQLRILKEANKNDPQFFVMDFEQQENSNDASETPPESQRNLSCNEGEESYHLEQMEEDDNNISWIPVVRVVEEKIKKDAPLTPRSSRRADNPGPPLEDPAKPFPFLLSQDQMNEIARHVLPKGIALCRWKRLYSLTRDGDSFRQCLRLCGNAPKTLLVITTTKGAVFGGYADAPWEVRSSNAQGKFHGSARACLFSFSIAVDKKSDGQQSTNLRVFPWTGANRYIQYTDTSENKRMLAFGGGGQNGSFGLCVEQDFQFGSTGTCDTFGNEPLCDQENFSILDMEIYGFLTGQF